MDFTMQWMRKQVILKFKPFNLILEYGQSNVLFDQLSFGISLLLAPNATFRFLFTNTNLYEFSKYGYVDNFSFLYATRNTTIFFTSLVLRKVNCESVFRNAIFLRKGMPSSTFDVRPD